MKEKELKQAISRITLSPEAKERMMDRLKNQKEEKYVMKTKKKMVLAVAAAVMILGASAFAAGGMITGWYGSSRSIPDYTSLPTQEECVKDVGFTPILKEDFANGYAFDNGSIVKNNLTDDSGSVVEKFKSLVFRYSKDGDMVELSQEQYESQMPQNGTVLDEKNGVTIYLTEYTNKIVPPSYEMTEEDRQAEESGELVFSWGSDQVEIKQVRGVNWEKDGTHFGLLQIDGALSAQELADMAKELI